MIAGSSSVTKKERPRWNCSAQEREELPDGFRVGFAGRGGGVTAAGTEPGRFRRRTGGTDGRADMDFSRAAQLDDLPAVFMVDSPSDGQSTVNKV